jgi:DNA polymerase-1
MENIKKFAHRDGYVETIYGRKIYLANINSANNILRQAEERLALNAPMQGSAADIIKIAMLNVNQWLAQEKLQTKMILQVHDELIFQVPNNEVDIIMANLSRLMSEKTQLAVPLEIEVKAAANWGKAH